MSHFTDEGLESGTYYYVVIAVGPGGESGLSNAQEVTVEITAEQNIPGYNVLLIMGIVGSCTLIMILRRKSKIMKNE